MDRINLQAILELKSSELCRRKTVFFKKWIKQGKCRCDHLFCVHASKEARRVFQKEEQDQSRIIGILKIYDLHKSGFPKEVKEKLMSKEVADGKK